MSRKTVTIKYGIEIQEPRRLPPWLKMLVIIAVVVVGIYALYNFVVWVLTPTEEDIILKEATPSPTATATPSPTASPSPTPRPSPTVNPNMSYFLTNARESGTHIMGWANIPGLGLDTVIAQWQDNEYFLGHDINLNSTPSGAVFFDYRSDISYIRDAGHIVIYGYNNLGDGQLKSVVKYATERNLKDNSLIVLETLYGQYHFRVFSVHIEDDDSEYVKPITEDEQKEYINMLIEKTMYIPNDFPESDSVILTISTDVESDRGSRLLVHAFLEEN